VRKVESEEEAVLFIEEMKKKYWDARHNCSAFVIGTRGELSRCSDDGEPSGTAGRPMLDVLLGEEIHDVAVVVTRYFGGTLLGTGGLVHAYTSSALGALKAAEIIRYDIYCDVEFTLSYSDHGKVCASLGDLDFRIDDTIFGANVTLFGRILKSNVQELSKKITEITSGRSTINVTGEKFDF
jgi:uncharacterized YigZ family protein